MIQRGSLKTHSTTIPGQTGLPGMNCLCNYQRNSKSFDSNLRVCLITLNSKTIFTLKVYKAFVVGEYDFDGQNFVFVLKSGFSTNLLC